MTILTSIILVAAIVAIALTIAYQVQKGTKTLQEFKDDYYNNEEVQEVEEELPHQDLRPSITLSVSNDSAAQACAFYGDPGSEVTYYADDIWYIAYGLFQDATLTLPAPANFWYCDGQYARLWNGIEFVGLPVPSAANKAIEETQPEIIEAPKLAKKKRKYYPKKKKE